MENKTKAAILYLCSSLPKYVADLKLSLSCLDKNFNDQFKYPVIVFHRDFTEELMQDVRKSTNSRVIFEKIKFEMPDFLDKDEIPENYMGYDLEYRHMCRFLGGPIYWQPALKDYDWYWRLDTDSFLLYKINYDIFSFMQKNDYKYGYITMLRDRPAVVEGLWEFVKKYIKENDIQPKFLNKFLKRGVWNRTLYYTNFEIGSLDFWRSDNFRKYFDYLDHLGGVYRYRWGDTAFRSLAVYIFMPEEQTHQFKDVGYRHQGFVNRPFFSLPVFINKQIFLVLHGWYWAEPLLGKCKRLKNKIIQKSKNFIKNTQPYIFLNHILEERKLAAWEKEGRRGPLPNLIKQMIKPEIVKEYGRRFCLEVFIETGTYLGNMISATRNDFKEIFSIELDKKLFKRAKNKFANLSNIHILQGDSGKVLPGMLISLKKPALFWLDAHYSGGITTRGDIDTPIEKELGAIFSHNTFNHVILIDDARHFTGKNGYPNIEWLKEYVLRRRPGWNFEVADDIIRIHPKNNPEKFTKK